MVNGHKKIKVKARKLPVYRSYRFIDKDPIVDAMRTAFSDSQLTYQQVHEASGVSVGTLKAWFSGGTKRPQFSTVSAFSLAVGKTSIRFRAGKPYLD